MTNKQLTIVIVALFIVGILTASFIVFVPQLQAKHARIEEAKWVQYQYDIIRRTEANEVKQRERREKEAADYEAIIEAEAKAKKEVAIRGY